jgi:hypothetical protein
MTARSIAKAGDQSRHGSSTIMKLAVVFGMIGLGLLLLVLSGMWVTLFPGTSSWTEEKAARWAEVKDRLHNLSFIVNAPPGNVRLHGGRDYGEVKTEYDQIKTEAEQLRGEFESAYNSPRTTSIILKWTGISLAGVGIVGWLAFREA